MGTNKFRLTALQAKAAGRPGGRPASAAAPAAAHLGSVLPPGTAAHLVLHLHAEQYRVLHVLECHMESVPLGVDLIPVWVWVWVGWEGVQQQLGGQVRVVGP